MLYNMNWLNPGQSFPPLRERARISRYWQNQYLFEGEHFNFHMDPVAQLDCAMLATSKSINPYAVCAQRINRVVGNFEDVISFPVLLNYQRLMTLKMADLVCGEYPQISGADAFENAAIQDVRDYADFDAKLYEAAIDISRYGESVQRVYKDNDGRLTFTNWDPKEWYPVVSQDGTNTITKHCLCWRENRSVDPEGLNPDWYLHVQIHGTSASDAGKYEYRVYKLAPDGLRIMDRQSVSTVATGLDVCAVRQLKAFSTTSTVYGYDDYMVIDSLLAEIMTRVGQISVILDKHADPNITGPISMLDTDMETGELRLKAGKFFAVAPGDEQPKYMTWEGQLSSAFKQLEILINQLYILSEMGAALLGSTEAGGQAISGTAMRFKMVNPIAKARRISNSLTRPVKQLFATLSEDAEVDDKFVERLRKMQLEQAGKTADELEEKAFDLPVPYRHISVFWYDGLPDDPRENIENAKLATGATKMMPLENAIMEYFGRTHEEALDWIARIHLESAENMANMPGKEPDDPNKPGPQDGTGVNPAKKGSTTGLNNFHGINNQGDASDE